MTENSDQIRADIERTQNRVSEDVDALGDKVDPRNIARRQVEKTREAATHLKDRVFGRDEDRDEGALGSAKEAAARASEKLRGQMQGNPLGVGMVAFGVGMLLSSLIPASDQEERLAARVKEAAGHELGDAAGQMADDLREPVREAADAVKDSAAESVENLKGTGQQQAQEVAGHVKDARG